MSCSNNVQNTEKCVVSFSANGVFHSLAGSQSSWEKKERERDETYGELVTVVRSTVKTATPIIPRNSVGSEIIKVRLLLPPPGRLR